MKLFEVTYKRRLNDNMVWLKVYAPLVAKHAKPGQFIILRTDEYGERIPLTMAGHDEKDGTIDLIYAAVGRTTMLMDQLEEGDYLAVRKDDLHDIYIIEKQIFESTYQEVK